MIPHLALIATVLIGAPNTDKPTLLVAPLQSIKTDPSNAKILEQLIRNYAGRSGRYTLVTPDEMGAIDEELKRQLSGGCSEASCIANIGGALGAQFMIAGSFNRLGSRYILTLKLVDIEMVKAIRTTEVMQSGLDPIVDVLEGRITGLLEPQKVQQSRNPRRKSNLKSRLFYSGVGCIGLGAVLGVFGLAIDEIGPLYGGLGWAVVGTGLLVGSTWVVAPAKTTATRIPNGVPSVLTRPTPLFAETIGP